MKKSVTLSLFEASRTAPILFSADIEDNIPYIKEIGYDGVDLFVHDPEAKISKDALRLLKRNGLGVGVVMPAALAGEGLFLSHKDPAVREEIVGRMRRIMIYAAEAGGMVSLGLVRGSTAPDESHEEVLKRFGDTVEKLIPCSEEYRVDLLVEPINRYEINTLNESREAFDFIRSSGLPLYLMLDTFHMNIEDVSIRESLVYCHELIKHVHFLDSNRLAPGMGHLDMMEIYETLKTLGYDGYLCLEALARPDGKSCALKGMEFFRKTGI
jgi:sugar phosphate isomerase/epimerase